MRDSALLFTMGLIVPVLSDQEKRGSEARAGVILAMLVRASIGHRFV
jgi:hypothetical protein